MWLGHHGTMILIGFKRLLTGYLDGLVASVFECMCLLNYNHLARVVGRTWCCMLNLCPIAYALYDIWQFDSLQHLAQRDLNTKLFEIWNKRLIYDTQSTKPYISDVVGGHFFNLLWQHQYIIYIGGVFVATQFFKTLPSLNGSCFIPKLSDFVATKEIKELNFFAKNEFAIHVPQINITKTMVDNHRLDPKVMNVYPAF